MADAEKTVRELLEIILNERGYQPREVKVKKISTSGANYTSALFLIYVNSQNKELKLFAKVATVGQEIRELMNADWMFRTERFFYNKLMHLYNDIQENLNEDDKFIFPKYYGCNAETGKETIVMENLVERGYKPYNRFKSMDWDHGRVGVENLAKFHALSFAFEKRDPEEFKKITGNMAFMTGNNEDNQASMDLWSQMVERAVSVLKEEHQDSVRKVVMKPGLFRKYNKPIGKPVLSHGDFRLSNMMYKREGEDLKLVVVDYQTVHAGCPVSDLIYFIFLGSDDEFRDQYYDRLLNHYYKSLEEALGKLYIDPVEVYPREKFESDLKEGEDLKLVVVDYQTVHAGCPVSDLIYFIFLGSDDEFRDQYYDRLLNHYYKSLEEALGKLYIDPVEVYPREKFESDLKELLHYVMLLAVMVLPVVTVASELAPKIDTDNADISSFMMKTNELYSKRFRGIVNDFIKWELISLNADH